MIGFPDLDLGFVFVQLLSCVGLFWCHELQHTSFLVLHYFPEFAQTHVHWVSNAIQPSHPLSSPSPPAFNLPSIRVFQSSQFFASGGQSIGAFASVLPMNIQDWFPLGLTGLISLQSKGLSRVFSNTTIRTGPEGQDHVLGTRSKCGG